MHGIGHAGGATIGWMIYLGIAPTAAGFVLWAYALARSTAGKMGSTTYLVPPLALLLGWVFLGEVPPASLDLPRRRPVPRRRRNRPHPQPCRVTSRIAH